MASNSKASRKKVQVPDLRPAERATLSVKGGSGDDERKMGPSTYYKKNVTTVKWGDQKL